MLYQLSYDRMTPPYRLCQASVFPLTPRLLSELATSLKHHSQSRINCQPCNHSFLFACLVVHFDWKANNISTCNVELHLVMLLHIPSPRPCQDSSLELLVVTQIPHSPKAVGAWTKTTHANRERDSKQTREHCRTPGMCKGSKASATGTWTRVARVRAEYPNQLDYSGIDAWTHLEPLRAP